jgi:hypothetical protein
MFFLIITIYLSLFLIKIRTFNLLFINFIFWMNVSFVVPYVLMKPFLFIFFFFVNQINQFAFHLTQNSFQPINWLITNCNNSIIFFFPSIFLNFALYWMIRLLIHIFLNATIQLLSYNTLKWLNFISVFHGHRSICFY